MIRERVRNGMPGLPVLLVLLLAEAASVWMLVAMIIAVRQALDYTSTGRAVAVCAVGWALSMALATIVGILFPSSVS